MIVAVVVAVGFVGVVAALVGAGGAWAAAVDARLAGGAAVDGGRRPVGIVIVVEVVIFLHSGRARIAWMANGIVVELANVALVFFSPFRNPAPTRIAITIIRPVVIPVVVIGLIHNRRRGVALIDIGNPAVAGVIGDFASGNAERRGTHRSQ